MNTTNAMMSWLSEEEKRRKLDPDELLNDPLLNDLEACGQEDLAVAVQHWRAILSRALQESQPVVGTLSNYTQGGKPDHLALDPMQLAELLALLLPLLHRWLAHRNTKPQTEDPVTLHEEFMQEALKELAKEALDGLSAPVPVRIVVIVIHQLAERWAAPPPPPPRPLHVTDPEPAASHPYPQRPHPPR